MFRIKHYFFLITFGFLIYCTSCGTKMIDRKGGKPHWTSWSRGKFFKSKKHASKNIRLEKEPVYLFVMEAEGKMPTFHRDDVEDIVRLKAASYYGSIIQTNIEEFLLNEKNLSDTIREAFIHKTNTLQISVKISGFLPVASYWETVKEKKEIKNRVYMLYSVNKSRLFSNMEAYSKEIGLDEELIRKLKNKQETTEERIIN